MKQIAQEVMPKMARRVGGGRQAEWKDPSLEGRQGATEPWAASEEHR